MDDYKADKPDISDIEITPEIAAMRELAATSKAFSPMADRVNLFAQHDSESNTVEVGMQFWQTPPKFDEPVATTYMDLQGLKDFHIQLGQAIAELEG